MADLPGAVAHQLSDPATWVAQHGDYLYRNALLRLGDQEAAEEVVQETLLAALQGQVQFSGRSSERTWMVGILKHKVIDCLRRASRETPLEDAGLLPCEQEQPFAEEGEWPGHWRNAALAPADWSNTPAALYDQQEFWQVLRTCLAGLPPRLAQAFALREIDQLESGEVCKVLGVSPTNLWVMLHRSRMQLRRCLELKWLAVERKGLS